MVLPALSPRPLVLASQTFQLQAGYREPRTCARVLLGQLALLMIERERIFLLPLLQSPQLLQVLGQRRGAALKLFEPGDERIGFALVSLLGAVYTGLDRLEANGLVSSSVGSPTPERGGRAKRYFRVTPSGMKAVRQAKRAFTRLWSGVPGLEGGRS